MDDLKQRLRAGPIISGPTTTLQDEEMLAWQDEAAAALDAKDAAIRGLLELIDDGAMNEPQVIAARAALTDSSA
jgi:hypothetical protein